MPSGLRTPAAALLLLALLLLVRPEAIDVPLAEAAAHEGQTVRTAGVLAELQVWDDGTARGVLARDGHGLRIELDRADGLSRGTWLDAEGRLTRIDGELRLVAASVVAGPAPEAPLVPLAALADLDGPQRVHGTVHDGRLHDGPFSVALGDGPWIDGHVVATGVLAPDDRCLCRRFHAAAVLPWDS